MANVLVAMPNLGSISAHTVSCLHAMQHKTPFDLAQARSSILPKSRRRLVLNAIEGHNSHILFIDSDMTFPKDLISKFLSHKKPVMAANCVYRQEPVKWTAHKQPLTDSKAIMLNSKKYTGIEKVWRVGTGIMMLETAIFKKLPQPWFMIGWNEQEQQELGEDYFLCQRLEQAGVDIWVDHDISKACGHVGEKVYTG